VTLNILGNAFRSDITMGELGDFLEPMYLPLILSGNYSRQRSAFGGWSPFDENDIENINTALS